jgi:hypothetical protein
MGRYARLPFILPGSWLTVSLWAATSYANTVILEPHLLRYPYGFVWMMLGVFVITVIVEYPVVYRLLGCPTEAWPKLLVCLALVNLITNPAVQMALLFTFPALITYPNSSLLMILPIELVVVIVEFGFFLWVFRGFHRAGALTEPITAKRTFVISLAANLASFVVGCLVLIAVEAVFVGLRNFGLGW